MILLLVLLATPALGDWIPNLEIQFQWQWAAGGDARVIPGRDVLINENIRMDTGEMGRDSPRNLDSFFVGFNLKWELGLPRRGGSPLIRMDSRFREKDRFVEKGISALQQVSDVSFEKIRIIKLKKLQGALGYELETNSGWDNDDADFHSNDGRSKFGADV